MKVNVLIDSSLWIEYFSKGPKISRIAKIIQSANKETYKTPSIILFEVYKKIKKGLNEQSANEAIAYIVDLTEIIGLNERIAVFAAEISIRTGLSLADAIVKATAELTSAELKTMDAHFKGLKDVEVIQ